ncbi:MAG: peptide ABC transporter substrate-binding protein [Thermomicrobiales bacterium]
MSADQTSSPRPLGSLYAALKTGQLSRRHFVESAMALGMTAAGAAMIVNTTPIAAAAQDASPEASPAAAGVAPAAGTEGQTRGAGGELKLLLWQAPSHLSPHAATGDKDNLAAQPVLEPLMNYAPDASFLPRLITEVPSAANGLLSADSKTVTFKLLPGIVWSDGEPFTSKDIVFTWKWITTADNGSVNVDVWGPIASIDTPDDTTAVVTFKNPTPLWFAPFTSSGTGAIYPQHLLDGKGASAMDAFRLKPIGTGTYVVESFSPNDQAVYVANEKYREPNKPFFSKVVLKGGGDAASAARAVVQTGEYDFAWNTQIEPEILRSMESDDSPGKFVVYHSVGAERIQLNFSDPDTEVDGQRSHVGTPNPRLSDPAVRQAIATAINRDQIASQLYFADYGESAGNSITTGIPALESKTTTWEYNPDKANQLLDDAGWVKDGDTRKKDGVELKVTYATTINQLRQKEQAIGKKNLNEIGIGVDLLQFDASIYFDSSPGNDQNSNHMYYDMNMHINSCESIYPLKLMQYWYAGKDNSNIAQKENNWNKTNSYRYVNPDYDAAYDAASTEIDPEKLNALLVEMNDIIILDHATIPLVNGGSKFSTARGLTEENIAAGPFEFLFWNLDNWNGTRP